MRKIKKLIFGITGLTLGGAERVLVDTANKLSDNYNIEIFTLYSKGELEKELKDNIIINSLFSKSYNELNKFQKIVISLKILLFKKLIYKKHIENRSDIEIAFLEGPITRIFSTLNNNVKKFAWVHNDISKVFGEGIKSRVKCKVDKRVYNKYDKIVCVSQDNLNKFNEMYSIREKVIMIPNYIEPDRILKKSEQSINIFFSNDQINFITVARLVEQKAIDRFIDVHAKLISNGAKNKVYVIGDGPLRELLNKKIKEKGVQDTFILLGKKENPYPYVKSADCFCLLSYYEGYGMVLEEAKILEKPIIITDTAAREAIINYNKGYICDNNKDAIYNELYDFITTKKCKAKDIKTGVQKNVNPIDEIKQLIEK